jgi:hypothetical protein
MADKRRYSGDNPGKLRQYDVDAPRNYDRNGDPLDKPKPPPNPPANEDNEDDRYNRYTTRDAYQAQEANKALYQERKRRPEANAHEEIIKEHHKANGY